MHESEEMFDFGGSTYKVKGSNGKTGVYGRPVVEYRLYVKKDENFVPVLSNEAVETLRQIAFGK